MARIDLDGTLFETIGELPSVGDIAPDATLVTGHLQSVRLHEIPGRRVLNIFPSIATGVCQSALREFNRRAGEREGVTVLNISVDLPFAQSAFCAAEGLEGVQSFSTFRGDFGAQFGVTFTEGPFEGLMSRSVVVLDAENRVVYTEQVPGTGDEPDYDAALAHV